MNFLEIWTKKPSMFSFPQWLVLSLAYTEGKCSCWVFSFNTNCMKCTSKVCLLDDNTGQGWRQQSKGEILYLFFSAVLSVLFVCKKKLSLAMGNTMKALIWTEKGSSEFVVLVPVPSSAYYLPGTFRNASQVHHRCLCVHKPLGLHLFC